MRQNGHSIWSNLVNYFDLISYIFGRNTSNYVIFGFCCSFSIAFNAISSLWMATNIIEMFFILNSTGQPSYLSCSKVNKLFNSILFIKSIIITTIFLISYIEESIVSRKFLVWHKIYAGKHNILVIFIKIHNVNFVNVVISA